jgi:hypothetical protein
MSLSTGLIGLHSALKDLRLKWQETQLIWNDSVRRDFDENLWQPLETQVEAAHRALDRLDAIVAQAQQDTK